ncbi:MAG: hypothetical protein E7049_10600 [Lentisphaerae bacterium]|nr:hypothetical protein [Lentisphaerota bacterium]
MKTLCGTILAVAVAAGVSAAPVADIPFDPSAVEIDGEMGESEWSAAAVLRDIRPLGSAYAGSCRTEFRVKHDGETVYVAVRCFETKAGYPLGFVRPWKDSFFRNDDCVEVVLGRPDPELRDRGTIDVGGYENAMGTAVAAADDYYSFAVNCRASRQLCYNEMPVGDDGFKSACRVGEGVWTVEMAIPAKTAGLDALSGRIYCANLFRYRSPTMLGWHLPAFGGYAPMPFGKFRFLREGESGGTVEDWPLEKPKADEDADVSASIEYGPLDHVVVGRVNVSGEKNGLVAELSVEGLPVASKNVEKNETFVVCDLPCGDQPERKAVVRVLRDGKEVCRKEKTCPAAKMPEWLGTKEGHEYLRDKIPSPWRMPEVNGVEVRLVDKTLRFGGNALPVSVMREGALSATFRSPVSLRIVAGGKEAAVDFASPRLKADGNRVLLFAEGRGEGILVRASAILDYDGFLDYTFSVEGEKAASVERLELVLPLCSAAARHFLPGNHVQRGGELSYAGWRGAGCGFWIGNEQEGLSFNFDESPFRSAELRRQISIARAKDGVDAVLAFADAKGQVSDGATFRFFLQPTPTKPYPLKPVRNRYSWLWEDWSGYHGYPDVSKTNAIAKSIANAAKHGKRLLLYCCQGLQEDAPELVKWRQDLSQRPNWRYYRWRGHDCFATCKQGPEGDFQLANWATIIRETGVSGLVGDGFFMTWNCSNPLHAHHAARRDPPKVGFETRSRTVMQRDFLKRVRGLFDRTGEPYCLLAHTGGGLDSSYLSFCDAYFEGEQLSRFRRGYYPSRSLYSIGYTGLPWGWRTIHITKGFHNYNGLDTTLCYALLHNSECSANPDVEPPSADTADILEPFSTVDTVFRPYWKRQDRVDFKSNGALLSIYERKDLALLVVGNLEPSPAAYELDFSTLYPGEAVHGEDVLLCKPVGGTRISETLAPFSCRVVRVKKGVTKEAAVQSVVADGAAGGNDSDVLSGEWTFRSCESSSVDDDGAVRIKASRAKGAASAVNAATFGRNLTVEGTLSCTERIKIGLGGKCISFNGGHAGGGWRFIGLTNPYGRGWIYNSVRLKKDTAVDFRLVLKDNVLDVWYDGQRLVRNLAIDLPPSGNRFSLTTWHVDKLEFRPKTARESLE